MDCPVLLRIVVLLSFPFCIRPARFQWQSSASASPSPFLSPSCYISIGQPAHSSLTRSLCITFRKLASPSSSPLHYTVTYATHKPSLPPSPSPPSPIFSGSPSSPSPSPILLGSSDGYQSSAGSSSSGIDIDVIEVIVVSVVIFIVIFICVCRKVCKAFKKASPNNNGNDLEVGMGIRAYATEQRGNNNGNDLEAGMGMGIRAYTTDQQRENSWEGLVRAIDILISVCKKVFKAFKKASPKVCTAFKKCACKAFKKASPNNNGNDLEVGMSMGIRAYTTDQRRGNSLEGLVTYTLKDLVRATNNFKTKIGHGASGFVYLANLPGGRMGAVKRAKDLDLKSFKEELSVLLRLPRHPHLVDLIGWCVQPDEKILVFEFICNGSLYDRLHKNKGGTSPLSWAARMDIASQLALALQYLHEKAKPPILHRDIKSANVLLVNDNCVKLADFGLAKLGPKDNQSTFTAVRGSYGYMDPQYMKTRRYSAKSDVYSFGVLLLELITGLKSIHDDTPLAEWTETYRSQGIQKFMTIVDQNMIADHINIMELQNMMMIADRCLGEISKERPAMIEIVNMMQRTTNLINSNGNLSVDGVEAPFMRNGNVSDGDARNINSNGNLSDGVEA